MLRKNFLDVYGVELNKLISRLENILMSCPGDIVVDFGTETDSVCEQRAEWYKLVVAIAEEVDVYCNDFMPMDIYRSILKGQWLETFETSQRLYNLGLSEAELKRVKPFEDFVDKVRKF